MCEIMYIEGIFMILRCLFQLFIGLLMISQNLLSMEYIRQTGIAHDNHKTFKKVAISGNYIVAEQGHRVKVWDLKSHALLYKLPKYHDLALVSGNQMVTRQLNSWRVWNLTDGKFMWQCIPDVLVSALKASGDRLVVLMDNNTIKIWDLCSGELMFKNKPLCSETCKCLAVSETLLVTASLDAKLKIWDLQTGDLS